jgi:hypothetical protein
MKPTAMHRLAHQGSHRSCSPKPWHAVPKVTGDFDLDATIMHRNNSDMASRLQTYVRQTRGSAGSYGPRSNYTGYSGNSGDD